MADDIVKMGWLDRIVGVNWPVNGDFLRIFRGNYTFRNFDFVTTLRSVGAGPPIHDSDPSQLFLNESPFTTKSSPATSPEHPIPPWGFDNNSVSDQVEFYTFFRTINRYVTAPPDLFQNRWDVLISLANYPTGTFLITQVDAPGGFADMSTFTYQLFKDGATVVDVNTSTLTVATLTWDGTTVSLS